MKVERLERWFAWFAWLRLKDEGGGLHGLLGLLGYKLEGLVVCFAGPTYSTLHYSLHRQNLLFFISAL